MTLNLPVCLAVTACLLSGWFPVFLPGPLSAQQPADSPEPPQVVDTRTGQPVNMEQLVSELAQCDVVFLGEQHNNDAGHRFHSSEHKDVSLRPRLVVEME